MKKSKYEHLKSDKLNLGCSMFQKKDFINLDISKERNPDIVHNLDKFPYPFEDNSFSRIEADHVLEHLKDPFKTMQELHRILKPNGILIIKTPHFSRGFTHPDHKRGFDVSFPLYFNKKYSAFFAGTEFQLLKMKLTWFAQPYMKKITLSPFKYCVGSIAGSIIDTLANLSPLLCSRGWCFLVGGFEEIKFVFRK